ncbi:hypothetical protein [Shewanella sp. Isolate11]|uniref:hypothetical protein n=1 Tax=Shewanella sp. Isolate11 TaxID=2908530 RepID=UPI001EFC4DCD|nr:hypothetical protein [Shewanella sp. Isolate11]MCG9698431.1 hypothetical protein [Shewanella sp. Isolate11]
MSTAPIQFLFNQRFWLSGPFTLLVSLEVMLAMAVWYPPGIGNVNNIMMPLVMFPLIWSLLFFYTYLTQIMHRAWWILSALAVINGAILGYKFLG